MASGYVVAPLAVAIQPRLAGRVATIDVVLGESVQKGQILLRLDSDDAALAERLARSDVAMARAQLAVAQAALDQARGPLVRLEALAAKGASSRSALEDARLGLALLEEQLAVQQHALAAAELRHEQAARMLDRLIVRAPFAGVIASLSAVPGLVVASAEDGRADPSGLMTLIDPTQLFVDVEVAEINIAQIGPNQGARVVLDAYPDREILATVLFIEPSASRQRGTVNVRLRLKGHDPGVLANMAAKVTFEGPSEVALSATDTQTKD